MTNFDVLPDIFRFKERNHMAVGAGRTATQVPAKPTTTVAAGASKLAGPGAAPIQHPPAQQGVISLNPATFTSGGLLDDADVIIADAGFLLWDYDGSVAEAVPALGITFHKLDDTSTPPTDHDQYYSCGKAADFVPSTDGSSLMPIGSKKGLNNNTNAALLISSLLNVGLPPDMLDSGNIKALIGTQLHVNQVPAPERTGLVQKDPNKKKTILVATGLLALPGEGQGQAQVAQARPAAAGRPAVAQPARNVAASPALAQRATPSTAATTTSPSNTGAANGAAGNEATEELVTLTTNTVFEILNDAGGTVPRKSLGPTIFAKLKGNAMQKPAMQLGFSEEFLGQGGGGLWAYDGVNVTLA